MTYDVFGGTLNLAQLQLQLYENCNNLYMTPQIRRHVHVTF